MNAMDPNDALDWMNNNILEIVEECVPTKKTARPKRHIPPKTLVTTLKDVQTTSD